MSALVWVACLITFVLGVWRLQERFTRRPGEVQCPHCWAYLKADLASVGAHIRAQHGIERGQN